LTKTVKEEFATNLPKEKRQVPPTISEQKKMEAH